MLLVVIGPTRQAGAETAGLAPAPGTNATGQSAPAQAATVVPVLAGGASLPELDRLPASSGAVQGDRVERRALHADVDRLIAAIESGTARRRRVKPWLLAVAGAALVALAGLVGMVWRDGAPAGMGAAPPQPGAAASNARAVARNYPALPGNAGVSTDDHAHSYIARRIGRATTVVDRSTQLLWQRGGSRRPLSREEADDYVAALNADSYAGYQDWRLPTRDEAMALMLARRRGDFYLDPAFEAPAAPFVWTSEKGGPGDVWIVNYLDAVSTSEAKDSSAYVRAVRGRGPRAPEPAGAE